MCNRQTVMELINETLFSDQFIYAVISDVNAFEEIDMLFKD